MDAMGVDQATGTTAKRKADEPPPHSTTPESKRLKPTTVEPESQNPNNQITTLGQEYPDQDETQSESREDQQHTISPTTTSTTPQSPSHREVYHSALRTEFHNLNRRLVQKRDLFYYGATRYESVVNFYEELSLLAQSSRTRTQFNDWAEVASIEVLRIFMLLEAEKRLIDAIERRLYFIMVELGGNV